MTCRNNLLLSSKPLCVSRSATGMILRRRVLTFLFVIGRHFCKNFVIPKKGRKTSLTKTTPTAAGAGDAEPEKKCKKHVLAECFYNKHVTPGHAGE